MKYQTIHTIVLQYVFPLGSNYEHNTLFLLISYTRYFHLIKLTRIPLNQLLKKLSIEYYGHFVQKKKKE